MSMSFLRPTASKTGSSKIWLIWIVIWIWLTKVRVRYLTILCVWIITIVVRLVGLVVMQIRHVLMRPIIPKLPLVISTLPPLLTVHILLHHQKFKCIKKLLPIYGSIPILVHRFYSLFRLLLSDSRVYIEPAKQIIEEISQLLFIQTS